GRRGCQGVCEPAERVVTLRGLFGSEVGVGQAVGRAALRAAARTLGVVAVTGLTSTRPPRAHAGARLSGDGRVAIVRADEDEHLVLGADATGERAGVAHAVACSGRAVADATVTVTRLALQRTVLARAAPVRVPAP